MYGGMLPVRIQEYCFYAPEEKDAGRYYASSSGYWLNNICFPLKGVLLSQMSPEPASVVPNVPKNLYGQGFHHPELLTMDSKRAVTSRPGWRRMILAAEGEIGRPKRL